MKKPYLGKCLMIVSDKLVADTETQKNALGEYVYDTRTENWLYDEEEDASKSVYVEKLDQLKTYGGPIAKRYHEAEERPKAVQLLQESIQSFILNAAKWLNEKLKAQESLPNSGSMPRNL
ncbi:23597_t:CDS:2 [Gigaspora rosea]|nr:23597_t:CDS:2 [Gigaspora rosea]